MSNDRIITTVEELDALPDDALIEDREGLHYLHNEEWYLPTDASAGYKSEEIPLPVIVRYVPKVTQ